MLSTVFGCTSQSVDPFLGQNSKINGVSFVANKSPLSRENTLAVTNINANYVTLMPFGFVEKINNPNLRFNSNEHWFGETKEGIKQYTEMFEKEGVKVMLKPQIWVWNGEFTGHIKMDSDADWILFEKAYKKFILGNVITAQELNIDIFCIGTELEQFVSHRPEFWEELILEIRKVYNGKLTYAANWNEFENTPFWDRLDFVGIDAYFPLSDQKTPSIDDCVLGWDLHINKIKNVYDRTNKQILFTEYGYRSVDYNAKSPWDSSAIDGQVNLEAQVNAYQALFDVFWSEDWFAGGFVWKWHPNDKDAGGINNNRFTPQHKPSEELLKKQYAKTP